MNTLLIMVTLQSLLGGLDNLWHHEITEKLPARRSARVELLLHSIREALYGCVFIALGWLEWRGLWAWLLGAIMLAEIMVTLADFVVEDRTRQLPATERVLHTILAIVFGGILALLVPILIDAATLPTSLTVVHRGVFTWLFSLFAVGVLLWSLRNAIAAWQFFRPAEWQRRPIMIGAQRSGRTVLVSGATGFIGGHLVRQLLKRGDRVIVWARDADKALAQFGPHVEVITSLAVLDRDLRIDAIVNLAGAPILGFPWTRKRRLLLRSSRLDITRQLVEFCASRSMPPRTLINASAVGYYGVRGTKLIDESADPQAIFQSQLCADWERVALAAETLGIRVVCMRFGVVLGRDGGALPRLALPVKLGAGAIIGDGQQGFPWIHISDAVRLIAFTMDRAALRGPINAVAPAPISHQEFQQALGLSLRRPVYVRIPAFILRRLLGEMSQLFADGQYVKPARALAHGFQFRFATADAALRNLYGKPNLTTRTPLRGAGTEKIGADL